MGVIKIVIPEGLNYISSDLLEKYAEDVYVIRYGNLKENRSPFHVINIPNPDICLGHAPVKLGCGRFENLMRMSDEILDQIDIKWKQVLIITDGTPESVLIAKFFQKKYTGYCGQMHLWAFLPIAVPGDNIKTQTKEYYDLLADLSEVKSLAVTNLNELVNCNNGKMNYQDNMNFILELTGAMLESMLIQICNMIKKHEAYKYFYDNKKNRYVITSNLRMVEKERVIHLMGLCIDDIQGDENKDISKTISKPSVRIDGKDVCNKLRKMRMKFAIANGIKYEYKICDYTGPCAGTCEYCEKEAEELYNMALANCEGDTDKVIFPREYLQDSFEVDNNEVDEISFVRMHSNRI